MARVLIELTDNYETGEMEVNYSFDPIPISVEEQDADMVSVAQDHGMYVIEQLLGRPLEDEDLMRHLPRTQ